MTATPKKSLPDWLLFVIGAALVVQFAGLGTWQASRGLEKRALQPLSSDEAGFSDWASGTSARAYQRLNVVGQFDSEHQILLDNIILDNRYGYYVLTLLALGGDSPPLLVNRGWIEKTGDGFDTALLAIDATTLTVRGRVGSLPKVGHKMRDAFTRGSPWPRHAVYPTMAEVTAALGHQIQPFVLLLEADEAHGFVRHWVPGEMGPSRHFAYAIQWFAMGAVLAALLIWHYRRRMTRVG